MAKKRRKRTSKGRFTKSRRRTVSRKRVVRTRGRGRSWGRAGSRAHPHRPRLLGSPGHFRSSTRSPWHHYRVNPHLLKEVGMMYGNPRRRRRHHYSHNPGMMSDVQHFISHPMGMLADGTLGALSAYLTISIPNWILPFPGADLMSRVIRLATRVAAGGLVASLLTPMARGSAGAIRGGAAIGAIGSTIFDFMGTRVIIGANDTGQTPLALLAPLTGGTTTTTTAPAATAAYARLSAYSAPMLPAARGSRATTIAAPPSFPARGIVRHNLF
jgi:hypothetical protein